MKERAAEAAEDDEEEDGSDEPDATSVLDLDDSEEFEEDEAEAEVSEGIKECKIFPKGTSERDGCCTYKACNGKKSSCVSRCVKQGNLKPPTPPAPKAKRPTFDA